MTVADLTPAAMPKQPQYALEAGARALGIALDATQRDALLNYLALLAKWNRVYNLTAIRDPRDMLVQHVLDSLAIVPVLAQHGTRRLLDVGAGAGLPGMVVAIAMPDCHVTLNDIVQKKTAFLTQAKTDLGLSNVQVITGRVESLQVRTLPQDAHSDAVLLRDADAGFDAIVSRAFAELSDFVRLARHLLAPDGVVLAMKGQHPEAEIGRLPADATVVAVTPLHVPFLDAQRHLVEVRLEPQ